MGYAYQPNCAACGSSWPELAIEHSNERAGFCLECGQFISLHRIWYTTQYAPCVGCGREIPDALLVDTSGKHPFRCPCCSRSDVSFDFCAHLFIVDEPPPLKVGAKVEARIDHWAIHVPDLPAIPLTHLGDFDKIDTSKTHWLIVTSTPAAGDSDRDYYFAIEETGNPRMQRSGGGDDFTSGNPTPTAR